MVWMMMKFGWTRTLMMMSWTLIPLTVTILGTIAAINMQHDCLFTRKKHFMKHIDLIGKRQIEVL